MQPNVYKSFHAHKGTIYHAAPPCFGRYSISLNTYIHVWSSMQATLIPIGILYSSWKVACEATIMQHPSCFSGRCLQCYAAYNVYLPCSQRHDISCLGPSRFYQWRSQRLISEEASVYVEAHVCMGSVTKRWWQKLATSWSCLSRHDQLVANFCFHLEWDCLLPGIRLVTLPDMCLWYKRDGGTLGISNTYYHDSSVIHWLLNCMALTKLGLPKKKGSWLVNVHFQPFFAPWEHRYAKLNVTDLYQKLTLMPNDT